MRKLLAGLDFGSDSGRAILVDGLSGEILAQAAMNYPRWSKRLYSDESESRYRHSPLDYLEVTEFLLKEMVSASPSDGKLLAIGVDATASTPILLKEDLSFISEEDPDAMFMLWKDHTALREAEEISFRAGQYSVHSGGIYSAENYWSKVLHVLRTNPFVGRQAAFALELCDYIPFILTGVFRKSRCAAASKQMWSEQWGGYPPEEFFEGFHPGMARIRKNLGEDSHYSTSPCGKLSAYWAQRLGLQEDVIVSVGNVDAHSGAIAGACSPDTMVFNLGTSACIMAVASHPEVVPGVFGQAEGSIIPGLEGFEMGLSSFGDSFAWFSRLSGRPLSELNDSANSLRLSPDLPLCTDWLNGRRSPVPEPGASATFSGIRLSTSPEALYYALVEANAFGIKSIVDHLGSFGISASRYVAIGGISAKSHFIMQLLSDVLGHRVEVSSHPQSCALGAVICASVAAGLYPELSSAQKALCPKTSLIFEPSGEDHSERYLKYLSYR
ncbi:MAG: ribulokinase [Candidatus Cryptobacteroides sp.]